MFIFCPGHQTNHLSKNQYWCQAKRALNILLLSRCFLHCDSSLRRTSNGSQWGSSVKKLKRKETDFWQIRTRFAYKITKLADGSENFHSVSLYLVKILSAVMTLESLIGHVFVFFFSLKQTFYYWIKFVDVLDVSLSTCYRILILKLTSTHYG